MYDGNPLFVFHGHQASIFFENFNTLAGYLLRFLAKPLGIKNYSVSQVKSRKLTTEKKVYGFSAGKNII